MAQNLYRIRELLGADLDDQVQEATREFDMQSDVAAQGPHLDKARLRGLPAVSRNVSGAIPGTDPLQALMDKYDEEDAA